MGDEFEFLDNVRKMIKSKDNSIKIYLSNDFENRLDQNYPNCDFYKNHKGEILSLIDQAVATQSDHFLKWPASSWSGRVTTLRQMKRHKIEPVTMVGSLEEHIGKDVILSESFWEEIENTLEQSYEVIKTEGIKLRYGAKTVMNRKIEKLYGLYNSVSKLL